MKTNPMIVMRRNGDGTGTFFDPDTGERINVNKTGRRIWEYLDSNGDKNGLMPFLIESFDGQVPPTVEAEVNSFITSLINRNFLSEE